MILEELTLNNFCLYRGEQCFDLRPTRRNGNRSPVVLFGGINGGGKTTLLDAVQLVFYGIRARCSKRMDKPYEEFLRDSIHHDVDPSEGAGIQLAFRYAAEGHEHRYEVRRSWSEVRTRIRERVRVYRDGEPDDWISENWSQLVEEILPFGIAQLCFFDAEKIRFLAEDETSTQALGDAIKSLLGLDLAERLVADAGVLESRIAKRAEKSVDLQEFERLEQELDATQTEIDRIVQEKGALENPRQIAQARIKRAEEEFARVGGKHWEKREARQRKLGEVGRSVKGTEEQLVALSATELPLAMVPALLQATKDQSEKEQESAESSVVSQFLTERDGTLIEFMEEGKVAAKTRTLVEGYLRQDRERRESQCQVPSRLHLSKPAMRLLDHLLDRGLQDRLTEASGLVERIESERREVEQLNRGIAATPKEHTVRDVAKELKEASRELASSEQQIRRLDKQLEGLRHTRAELDGKMKSIRRKVVDEEINGEESSRLAKLVVRTQETMKEFLSRATNSKIDRLSESVSEAFRFLLRKKTLVSRVVIDPDTFSITLLDGNGRSVPKQRLSEGEKQIFAISVLWGLSRASARPLPAIIDTPMARLDAEHRDKLVQRYFPHASHQVIVLSTDTEIEKQYFHDLQPHIARAYHLNYREKEKVTVAEEGYFWGAEPVVELEEAKA